MAAAGNLMGVTAGSHRRVPSVVRAGDAVLSNVAKDICKSLSDCGQHALVFGAACFQRCGFCSIGFQVKNQGGLMIPLRPHTPIAGFGST